MRSLLLLLAILTGIIARTQNIAINNDASLPDNSALLDIKSSTKGILIPRMHTNGITAIINPAKGLLVLDTAKNQLMVNMGTPSVPNWQTVVAASGWGLSGNTGIDSATNFIGTVNTRPFIIRVNNNRSGYLDTITNNTSFGFRSLEAFTTGHWNTGIGFKSLSGNTTGVNNTGVGWSTLRANISGSFNTAIGSAGLYSNTTGSQNTALGQLAMYLNTTGNRNTVAGSDALRFNTTGSDNVAIGYTAGYFNTTGYSNTAIGTGALFNTGNRNNLVAIGDSALFNNGTGATEAAHGIGNTAVGSKTLFSNTTGFYNTAGGLAALYANTTGFQNTAFGTGALRLNTTGGANTSTGFNSMFGNTTGNNNSAYGNFTLSNNSTGSSNSAFGTGSLGNNLSGNTNTAMGFSSLYNNQTGYSNVAIGTHALFNSDKQSNLVAVGDSALFNNGLGAPNSFWSVDNTAIGSKSLFGNTIGVQNTAGGSYALYTNSEGIENTAFGSKALRDNTVGNLNTSVGANSMRANTTGANNTTIGAESMINNFTGDLNSAVGVNALNSNTSGSRNTAVGVGALILNTVGTDNTALGYSAFTASGAMTNATAIGANAFVGCSNCMVLGSINGVNGAANNVNVGIGTSNPDAPLSFGNIPGKKITFYSSSPSNQYGIGVQGGLLQIYSDAVGADIAFGYGTSAAFIERMRVKGNGNIGVGTSNPATRLDVAGASNWDLSNTEGDFRIGNGTYRIKMGIALDGGGAGAATIRSAGGIERLNLGAANTNLLTLNGATGNVGVGTETPSQKLHVVGNILATGTITPSDMRFKKNIEAIQSPLERLNAIRGVTYEYDSVAFTNMGFSNTQQIGFIAQDVERVFPTIVFTDNNGYKAIDYPKLIPVLTEAIKAQQQQIEELKRLVHQLLNK